MSNELYHYGVKGMKWGVRRAEKRAARQQSRGLNKLEKAYIYAGDSKGKGKYTLDKGRKQAKAHQAEAKAFEKSSKQYAKEGKKIRSKITKVAANISRNNAKKVMDKAEENAQFWLKRSERYKQKASKISTEKNVSLGRNKVNNILKTSFSAGYDMARELDRYDMWEMNK